MECPEVLRVPILMTSLLVGCSRPSSPPAGPAPPGSVGSNPSDAAAIVKAVQEAASAGNVGTASAGGMNHSAIQVGSRRLKTTMDVPVSCVMHGESAVISFGGRKVVVEFDKERVVLDGAEQAKLPAGAKEVEIQFVSGRLSVTADGTAVPTAEPTK